MATNDADLAGRLARVAHQLIADDMPWTGSPLAEKALEEVATAAARQLDAQLALEVIAEAVRPEALLHQFMAIVWAAGFKAGSMYSEQQA